jgi:membrane-associated protease RseP (regulator of RpoE activity)
VFGERLFSADAVDVNPFFVAGWAGLIINSINLLPVGELDGQRIFLGMFGRRAAARVGAGAASSEGAGQGGG